MNPVIYFDELDKVSNTPKGEEIINLLIHLTDFSQNGHFMDKYYSDVPLDLSKASTTTSKSLIGTIPSFRTSLTTTPETFETKYPSSVTALAASTLLRASGKEKELSG